MADLIDREAAKAALERLRQPGGGNPAAFRNGALAEAIGALDGLPALGDGSGRQS